MGLKKDEWIGLALTVGAALLAGAWGKRPGSSKGAPGSARSRWDPLSIGKRRQAALESGNPAEMRRMAALFREAGYEVEALELEAAAISTELERAQQGGAPPI